MTKSRETILLIKVLPNNLKVQLWKTIFKKIIYKAQ